MNDSLILKIVTDPIYALLTLLSLTTIIYYYFTRIVPLNHKQWKRMDFIWLSLSLIAIFGIVNSNKQIVLEVEYSRLQMVLKSDSSLLVNYINDNHACAVYNKIGNSPDIEELKKMSDTVCLWSSNLLPIISLAIEKKELIKNIKKPQVNDKILANYIEQIVEYAGNYNADLSTSNNLKLHNADTKSSVTTQFLSCIFLIFGFAIRFAKTAGELNLEEKIARIKE